MAGAGTTSPSAEQVITAVMQHTIPQDEAFVALYQRYRTRLVRLCRKRLGQHGHDAEAVAQEAFMRAWEAAGRYAADRPFWPWVSTIARRLCVDYLRIVGRDNRMEQRTRNQRVIAPPEADEDFALLADGLVVRQAVGSLSPRHQRLVQLHHIDGWSYEDIAAAEHTSVEAVRGALKRARAMLRASYEELVGGLAALPGIAGVRRALDRILPWVARAGDVRPPAVAALALFLGATLHAVAPPSREADDVYDRPASPTTVARAASTSTTTAGVRSGAGLHRTSGIALSSAPDGIDQPPNPSSASSEFEHVAVAPNDEVYASGQTSSDVVDSFAIVRSRDGGRTWERLPAVGFAGGRLLFPPAYPADSRIFVTSPRGLSISKDGGHTFLPLSVTPGYAAMSPAFSDGHEVFLSGNAPGWFFDASRAVATPSDLAVPPSAWDARFAFSPRYAEDGIVYVGANTFVAHFASMGQRPVVYVCRRSTCTEAARGGSRDSSKPEFVVSPTDGTVWAFVTQSLWRSRDGSSFQSVPLPAQAVPSGVVVSGGTTYLSMQPYFGKGGLYRSLDGGDTWEQLDPRTFTYGPIWVAAVSDGTLIAAQSAVDGGGLLRSTDGGVTWQQVL